MFLDLLLATFSLYRLAQLIAIDDGPMFVFEKIRSYIAGRAYLKEQFNHHYSGWQSLNDGIRCPYCVGLWLAIPIGILVHYNLIPDLAWLILGIAGMQSFLWRLKDG